MEDFRLAKNELENYVNSLEADISKMQELGSETTLELTSTQNAANVIQQLLDNANARVIELEGYIDAHNKRITDSIDNEHSTKKSIINI